MTIEHTLLLWTMIGTAGTALFTGLLSLFAWKAWRASSDSLGIMRDQEKATATAAAQQVEDQTWGRQIEALARYIVALMDLAETNPVKGTLRTREGIPTDDPHAEIFFDEDDMDKVWANSRIERSVRSAGSIWRLLHREESMTLKEMKSAENALFDAFIEATLKDPHDNRWRNATGYFIDAIQEWQASENKTEKAHEVLRTVHLNLEYDPLAEKRP